MRQLTDQHPHLLDYLIKHFDDDLGVPVYLEKLDRKHKKLENPHVLYPADGPVFIHIYPDSQKGRTIYSPVEPTLNDDTVEANKKIMEYLTSLIKPEDVPKTTEEHIKLYDNFVERLVEIDTPNPNQNSLQAASGWKAFINKFVKSAKLKLDPVVAERVRYYFIRNKIGLGRLQPLILDPYIEDITCNGKGPLFVEHKIFESLMSNIIFETDEELDAFALYLSERSGRPASHSNPVVWMPPFPMVPVSILFMGLMYQCMAPTLPSVNSVKM